LALALQSLGAAPATEVGEWVEAQAVDTLEERARWIADIESDALGGLTEAQRIVSSVGPPSAGEATATDTSVDVREPSRPRTSRRFVIAGLAVAVVAVAVLVGASFLQAEQRAAVGPPSEPSAATSAAPLPSISEPTPPPSSSGTSTGAVPSTSTSRVRTAPPAKPECNPPYTLSPTGRKTYKRNCL
jgi:hypothetical protein